MTSIDQYGSASIDYAQMRRDMFAKTDADKDDKVSLDEFIAGAPADAPADAPDASEIFAEMDTDGDGYLSDSEFASAPPPPAGSMGEGLGNALSSDLLSAILDILAEGSDSDDDQTSEAEASMFGDAEKLARMIEDIMAEQDADGDGQLSLEEFAANKPEGGPEGGPDAAEIFAEIDADGDGYLSEEELAAMPPPPPGGPGGPGAPGGASGGRDVNGLIADIVSLIEGDAASSDETASSTATDDSSGESDSELEEEILALIQDALDAQRNHDLAGLTSSVEGLMALART